LCMSGSTHRAPLMALPALKCAKRVESPRRLSGIERAAPWEVARPDKGGELIVRDGGTLPILIAG
jgi:hypothetical protein